MTGPVAADHAQVTGKSLDGLPKTLPSYRLPLPFAYESTGEVTQFEDGTVERRPGDFVNIPAHTKHRVEWTTPYEPTIWLAVHYDSDQGGFARHMMNATVIYLSLVCVMSVVCFAAYGLDKRRAVNRSRRVPEQTLQILALSGGWPGALLGQRQFRHKTKKLSFLIVFWCVVVLHVAVVGAATYVFFGNPLQKATNQG